MKFLRKYNESANGTEKLSDQDIIDFFSEWYDDDPSSVEINDIIINTRTKDVLKPTTYFSNVDDFIKGKMIKLLISESNGLSLSGTDCLTDFNVLESAISTIKRFYIYAGEDDINYSINNDYDGLTVTFIVKGDKVKSSDKSTIDELLGELKNLFKKKYKSVIQKENWLEIKHPRNKPWNDCLMIQRFIKNLFNGHYDNNTERYGEWVNWKNKVLDKGLNIKISGGDYQSVFSLKSNI